MNSNPRLKFDYKGRAAHARLGRWRWPRTPTLLMLGGAAVIGTILAVAWDSAEAKREPLPPMVVTGEPGEALERLTLPLELPPPDALLDEAGAESVATDADGWIAATVASGDTLSALFTRMGLSVRQMHEVLNAGEGTRNLHRLRPGEELRVRLNANDQLEELVYQRSRTEAVHVTRGRDGLEVRAIDQPVEVRTRHAWGTIGTSFYAAAKDAGLSDNVIMGMADIFGWDIDFAMDLRAGDAFSLIYEEQYLDGDKIGDGAILAAEFHNRGRAVQAVRFVDPDGNVSYYTPEGLSMRKAFLRTPVDFRRISSRFQPARHHPILGQRRPHRGVDYAAPTGTPIKASGDGRITYRGNRGGYGLTIIIDHGRGYETLYAHMSSFRRGLQTGSRVRQGQVIGYVGMSGMATGPHLHYEFRVNGTHRDPLTVRLPNAEPIRAELKPSFQAHAATAIAQLDLFNRAVAAAQDAEM
ncbi:peptidoglycan DD-metalloendopeptidase family protein [Ectothiorhodospiraceae bacterium 2226]|nr:peptidoglycan DD-metalloendopeptidase family protein [Ectothiorhodospiraceae bacterium 2226]